MLDVFHYENRFEKEDGSYEKFVNNHSSHSDSGILTVVPCSDVAGLDVLDLKTKQWIALEKTIHLGTKNHRDYGIIFWGDSFEYLVKGRTEACMHRVSKCNSERYSIVFKMRTNPKTTAPRYQEDYELAAVQLKALDAVNKIQEEKDSYYSKLGFTVVLVAGLATFLYKRLG